MGYLEFFEIAYHQRYSTVVLCNCRAFSGVEIQFLCFAEESVNFVYIKLVCEPTPRGGGVSEF